ncbi:MAG: HU family DNA-binding protein [Gammaproteobacteria bacterium]|nr:HU family DNA-binding protein [Gammaproteobacteria bacterium]
MTEHIYESAIREQIARQSRDSKKQLQQFSGQLFDSISQGLLQDGHVRIHQFGSFKLNWAKERRGRHPKTGEPLIIPAQPRISFTPARALKDQVNTQPSTNKSTLSALQPVADDKTKTRAQSTAVLNRKTALAASIIVALLASLMLRPGNNHEKPPAADINTQTVTSTELQIATEPTMIQASNYDLINIKQPLNSAMAVDTETEPQVKIQSIADTATDTVASVTQQHQLHSSSPYFKQRPHELVDGDSLWRLARRHYINPFYWPHIYQANRIQIDNPNKLTTGNIIQLPSLYGAPDKLSPEDRRSIAEGYFLVYLHHKKTSRPFPYYALLGANKFDPMVIQQHISEIDEQDWHSLQLASN